jgi:hypothetical protein
MGWFTLALAAATAVTAFIFWRQLNVMQGQLDEMRTASKQTDTLIETNKGLLDATKASADAAKRSADIAEAGVRAWLAPVRISFVDLADTKEPLKVRVFYQNVGREPARNVKNWTAFGYVRNPSLPAVKWNALPTWQDAAYKPEEMCRRVVTDKSSVIYPSGATLGQEIEITNTVSDNPLSEAALPMLFAEVKEQHSMFLVLGCFTYETMNQTRHSTFCAFLVPVLGKDISAWSFAACPVGNDDY